MQRVNSTLASQGNRKQEKYPLRAGEFIGKKLKIVRSSCKDAPGVQGKIVDETTNTFVVDYLSARKRIPKANSIFEINGVEVNGDELVGRPEDRTKKFA